MTGTLLMSRSSYEAYQFHLSAVQQMPGVKYWLIYYPKTKTRQVFLFEKTGPYNIRFKPRHHYFRYEVFFGTQKLYDTDRLGDLKNLQYMKKPEN